MSPSVRFRILERDKFTCRYCGAKAPDVKLEVDHITPRAKGGSDETDNLVTACADCNGGKSDRVLDLCVAVEAVEVCRRKARPRSQKYRNLYPRGGVLYYESVIRGRRRRYSMKTDDWDTAAATRDALEKMLDLPHEGDCARG